MPLLTGVNPPVDPDTFMEMPYRERIKTLSAFWGEWGFGTPKVVTIIYIVKLLVLYGCGGIVVATLTSGLSPLHAAEWFKQPIIWQKFVLWTMLLEAFGVAGTWGPLAGHFKPMTGGVSYWARVGTIRLPPWPDKVPFTAGDERTPLDVGLYLGFLASLVLAIVLKGGSHHGIPNQTVPGIGKYHGALAPWNCILILVLLGLLGLRDKTTFLAARTEQYAPAIIMFACFPFVDMVVGAKLLILSSWMGAAVSKMNRHFGNVLPPMVSNTPWLGSRMIKRLHYRNFPTDLRPSEKALRLAHGPGTVFEFVIPLVLLFSHNETVTIVAAIIMLGFHTFIISTFPLAVPLEWNLMFMFLVGFLFLQYPAYSTHDLGVGLGGGFDLGHMGAGYLILTLIGLLIFPILGELKPKYVSFLPSMRQYAGNWASAMWAFAPGCEEKLDSGKIVKPAQMQKAQLPGALKISENEAEVVMQQLLGWRSLHSQGRGLNSVMMNTLGGDLDHYTPREAEFSCNALIGWNFGDGHLHNERMINAIQRRVQFAPGEFIVVWVESEAILSGRQEYWVMDAAVGIIERGSWSVADCCAEQPWLPNGPIKTDVTWRLEGYERVRYPSAAGAPAAEDSLAPVSSDAPPLATL